MTRYGPSISHLFFADDLILFARANRDQMEVLNRVLTAFCQSSSQMISKEKLVMYYLRSVPKREARIIGGLFNFSLQEDLWVYLGVPLLHQRVNKSTYERVVDRVLKKLCSW